MRLNANWLLLAVVFGVLGAVVGCRSRADFVASTSAEVPTRTAAFDDEDVDVPPADEESDADAEVRRRLPDPFGESAEAVSTTANPAETRHQILKAAGADLEIGPDGHAVGIDLTEGRVTPDVVRSMAELSELQWADLRGAQITNADLAVICTLPKLQLLALGDTLVTDAGMPHINQQSDLRFLSLDGTAVTDAGLERLSGLPRLEGVSVVRTAVSRSGASALEKRLPGCRVILDRNAPDAPSPEPEPKVDSANPGAPAKEPLDRDTTWFLDDEHEPAAFPQPRQSTPVQETTYYPSDTARNLSRILQQRLLDPEVLTALSQHLLAQQDYPKAARSLEALARLQPENRQVRFDLGVALARSGEFETARHHLTQVVGEATANYNLGVIAYEQNLLPQSELYFARAVELASDFGEARQWLSRVRSTTTQISPTAHVPADFDGEDLVNLLMSEFGSVGGAAGTTQTAGGIEIVPAARSKTR